METFANQRVAVLPLRNTVLFPGTAVPLRVGRPRSVAAVHFSMKAEPQSGWILAIAQKTDGEPGPDRLHLIGTLARVEKVRGNEKDGYQVIARGVHRFRVSEWSEQTDTLLAEGTILPDMQDSDDKTRAALLQSLKTLSLEALELLPADTSELKKLVKGIDDLGYLADLCAANLDLPSEEKQALLENTSLSSRVLRLLDLVQKKKESLRVQQQIGEKLSQKMGKAHRESILREQLRAIQEELGDEYGGGEGGKGSLGELAKKIESAGMPEDTRKLALDELNRLKSIGNNSPESHVIRNYLDLLCALPWSKSGSKGVDIDLAEARNILDQEHYGLEKIKRRILQHLGVIKLRGHARGSILLLVGPPGVGKTSLGQSIAKVLGRKFVRTSLGGLRDDSEVRGHRRTYVGAMPGRIIQSLKRAGENDPVMMLDEIDKLSRGYSGDPAGALLEVLDPEQNSTFMDHYLDVPFDLSKVFFIATANSLESIPAPLLDRMEVIEVSGYTTAEKLHIAKRHLWPKQLSEHGMSADQLTVSDEALLRVITHYTREAGVRELQRQIATLCRASAEKILAKDASLPVQLTVGDLRDLLGPEKHEHEVIEHIPSPGVVTGLAWTPHGGDILFIEASLMPGDGKLLLTGQLGDVMKESAQIALSLVKSKLPLGDYRKSDIHIHVPSGAIPKDGPSAGVTLLTTLASLFSGRSVSPKLAMTGEITLRGAVMPVGGIKEKVMAAHRAGIERIILSRKNQKDLGDVPEEIRRQLRFEFVDHVNEVLKHSLALELDAPQPKWPESPASPSVSGTRD